MSSERAKKLAEAYMMGIEDYAILDTMDDQEKAEAVLDWLFTNGPMTIPDGLPINADEWD